MEILIGILFFIYKNFLVFGAVDKQLGNKYNLYLITILLIFSTIVLTKYFTSFKKNQIFSLQKLIENTYLNKTSNSIIQNLNPSRDEPNFTRAQWAFPLVGIFLGLITLLIINAIKIQISNHPKKRFKTNFLFSRI